MNEQPKKTAEVSVGDAIRLQGQELKLIDEAKVNLEKQRSALIAQAREIQITNVAEATRLTQEAEIIADRILGLIRYERQIASGGVVSPDMHQFLMGLNSEKEKRG